jgi:hypothetical protein
MEKFTFEIEAKLDKATKSVEALTDSVEELKEAQKKQVEGLEQQVKDLEKQNSKTTKAVKGLAKGFKGVGLAMKAAGIGIVLALVNKLGEAMMKNQTVADLVETAFTAIGMVFKEVSDRLISVYNSVSEATGGFDALKKVLGGALTIAINVIVGAIQGIVLGVQKARLAWEDSFLGGKDPEKIKQLQADIDATQEKLAETGERIKTAGKQIGDNFVEAVTEVGTLAQAVAEETANAIQDIDMETIASNAERVVQNKKNYALMEAQSRRLIEQYDLEAETQRQIRDDVSLSIEDRIKANEELGKVLQRQSDEEKEAIQNRINALLEQQELEGKSHELTTQLYDLQTEMLAIDAKVAGFKSEQLTNEVGLKQELLDLDKSKAQSLNELAIAEANFAAEQETNELSKVYAKQAAFELEKELELERLQFNIDNTKAGTQARIDAEAELAAKQQEYTHQRVELDKLEAETKKAMVQQGLDAAINAAGAESKVGKALFVAKQALALKELIMNAKSTLGKATMNAAESGTDLAKGAGKAASSAPPPFNLIPIAMFAAQAVGIVSSIKKAMSKTKQATAAAGGGAGVGSISAPTSTGSAAPRFNVVGASQTSQLAETIAGKEQKPIKAYVTSSDVTSAQSLDRNIVEEAGLG